MKHVALLSLCVFASTASAEPGDPTFDSLSMDRLTPISTFGVEFGYESWDNPGAAEIDVWTLNVAGHFVSRRGVGVYFTVPMTYLDLQLGPFEDSDLALGNAEVGGLFTKFLGGQTALIFHAGLGLPTAQDDGASAYQFFGAFTRLSDAALHVTNSMWLRLGLSPMGRSGNFLWRADLGVDIGLDEDNAVELSPIFYLNIGGGFDLGKAMLLVELVNAKSDPEDNSDDDASHLTIGARFTSGDLRPGIGILLPIGFEDGADEYELAILASLAVRVPSL